MHQPNLQGVREISVILLTVVGDGWKDQYILQYTNDTGSKPNSFLRNVFLSLRRLYCTAYIVRGNAKKLTSVGLFYKDVILFLKNILRVQGSLRKIK